MIAVDATSSLAIIFEDLYVADAIVIPQGIALTSDIDPRALGTACNETTLHYVYARLIHTQIWRSSFRIRIECAVFMFMTRDHL